MDAATLQQCAAAAREFAWTPDPQPADGPVECVLRVPTRHDTLMVARRLGAQLGALTDVDAMLITHEQVATGLVRWQGLRVGHVLPGHADARTPLEHSTAAVRTLLDARPDWAAQMAAALAERTQERMARLETAAGN